MVCGPHFSELTCVSLGLHPQWDMMQSHQPIHMSYYIILISLDGCLPESTTVQSTIMIMWPEVAITDEASVECPCGTVSCN